MRTPLLCLGGLHADAAIVPYGAAQSCRTYPMRTWHMARRQGSPCQHNIYGRSVIIAIRKIHCCAIYGVVRLLDWLTSVTGVASCTFESVASGTRTFAGVASNAFRATPPPAPAKGSTTPRPSSPTLEVLQLAMHTPLRLCPPLLNYG